MEFKKDEVKKYINDNQEEALQRVSQILGAKTDMPSFNGIIGGKNDTYSVDALNYNSPEEYVTAWFKSHRQRYESQKNVPRTMSSHRLQDLLQDRFVREFSRNYLARTYFNKWDKVK